MDVVAERLDAKSDRPISVALSGGGDSLALLCATVIFARSVGRRVIALTVDHQLSNDSSHWTERAGHQALALGAEWRSLVWTGAKPATGLPAASRRARHRLLADAARREGSRVILLGHTADDVREALDMRATDTPGLGLPKLWSASPVWPEGRGVALLRPLLNVERETLRRALRAQGLSWIDDPANSDPRYARARARLRLVGKAPPAAPAKGETCSSLTDFAHGTHFSDFGDATVSRDALVALPRRAGRRALGALLPSVSGSEQLPRPDQVERLLDRLADTAPVSATLVGATLCADDRWVRVGREVGDGRSRRRQAAGVFDGRFESNATESLLCLKGQMKQLDPADRDRLKAVHPRFRPGLPVWRDSRGVVHLAGTQIGAGPSVRSLAQARFRLACGVVQRESELDGP